jgi:hypothetical protein
MTPRSTLSRLKSLLSAARRLVHQVATIPLANRALHAAWQGATLVLLADGTQLAHLAIWKTAVAAAGAAALSAAKTYLFNPPATAPQ